MRWILLLYNLLFPVVLLGMLPGALLRMWKRGNYAHKFGQRFAWFSRRTRAVLRRDRGGWIWVHAVSVGEVLIAQKFIRRLRAEIDVPVLLSTTTSTGFQLANEGADPRTEVIYHPVDFLPTVARVVGLIRPAALVLVEAEIWPNLTFAVKKTGAPVILINGRLSPRSQDRYRRVRPVVTPLFRQIDAVCVQSQEDVGRYVSIGFLPDQLRVMGSIKFDPAGTVLPDPSLCAEVLQACHIDKREQILLGASTHSGEEIALAKAYRELKKELPGLALILVPRHAERSTQVLAALSMEGFDIRLRSGILSAEIAGSAKSDIPILLVDTTGELRQWTQLASVVFIGKSLAVRGGQNPAEAILAGKPVVFGPHMENFAGLVKLLLACEGVKQISTKDDLIPALRDILTNPDKAAAMAHRASSVLEFHRGATERSVALLRSMPRSNAQG